MTNKTNLLFPSDVLIGVLKAPNTIYPPKQLPFHLRLVASRKKDGVRCLIVDGVVYSAQMKQFRNVRLPDLLESAIERSRTEHMMYDMELCDPTADHHAQVTGALNSHNMPLSQLVAHVFDTCSSDDYRENCGYCPYSVRIPMYIEECEILTEMDLRRRPDGASFFVPLEQVPVADATEVERVYTRFLAEGDEGAIIRATEIVEGDRGLVGGWYKHGRATKNQGIIFKMKPFETADGIITRVIERMTQDTPRKPTGMVGAFEITYIMTYADSDGRGMMHHTCHIGFALGFDHAARKVLWDGRDNLVGKWCEFTHMAHGAKLNGGLRHGRFVRMRPDKD